MNTPAGRLRNFLSNWKNLEGTEVIIQWVNGYKIPFTAKVVQEISPKEQVWSKTEKKQIYDKIEKLLENGAIRKCQETTGQFISNIFLMPKPNGSCRLILNLKKLNQFIEKVHFKFEDIRTVKDLMHKDCFMATIDLKDAYYLISIDESDRKYLRFRFEGHLFEFTCLPFGLNTAPYVFTKIMKPVISQLRQRGYTSVIYLDDIWLLGRDKNDCADNVLQTRELLESLGFIINQEKSQLIPMRECKYLGFILNSRTMKIELPMEKKLTVMQLTEKFKKLQKCTIREFASMIGKLGSYCQAVKYGRVYLKDLEREEYYALRDNYGNFEAQMVVSPNTREDFSWWNSNVMTACDSIIGKKFCMEICSDASLKGWGACAENETAHGFWSETEKKEHINYLELLAAFFGLKCFAEDKANCDILLRIDNTTAIAYINHMGGTQIEKLSKIAKEIWQWCEKRNLWVFASYIKSEENTIADYESRRLEPETEFEISKAAFKEICCTFGKPDIDLFASRVNTKCKEYVSWKRDPNARAINAFTVDWSRTFFYAFPPFAIISRVIKKIDSEKARGILVVPNWPSQPWYPRCMEMFESKPITFKPNKKLLQFSNRTPHPLWAQLSLVAGISSGRRTLKKGCRKKQSK